MITITNTNIFGNRFRNEKTEWLLGVTPETITATMNISIGWYALATASNTITFNNAGFVLPAEIIKSNSPLFSEFNVGDLINITNTTSNNATGLTVTEKISNFAIRVGGASFVAETSTTANVIGKTPITALSFFYGLIENNEALNYLSKIDNSNQVFIANSIDATDTVTVVNMLPDGVKSWQNGSMTIQGNGVDTYNQKFIITHTFQLLPSFLDGQFTDIQNGIKASYYNDVKCLKYVSKIIGLYQSTDPNKSQTGINSSVLGNTGQYDENFNNKPTNYYIDSVVHKNPYNVVLSGVELTTTENTFEIVVKNTVNTPFSNTNTKLEIGFSLCPNSSEYTDTTKDVYENFALDKALLTLGGATLNGDLYGTDEQIFKGVTATFVSSSEVLISGKIALTQNLIDRVKGFVNQRYLMYVITQKHTLSTTESDKVSLLVEATDFFQDLSEVGLIEFNNNLIPHNNTTLAPSIQTEYFNGDEVILDSLINYDLTGLNGDLIDFKTLTTEIYATNGVDEFVLESFVYNFASDSKINGVTFVNFSQNRNFKLTLNDDRRLITIERRTDLDVGDLYVYEVKYPFAIRWEYWVQQANVNNTFFDILEPFNGKNNFWHRFNSLGFTLNIRHKLLVDNNGFEETFTTSEPLPTADYDSNADWINEYIKSYDSTPTELTVGGNKYVQSFAETTIEAFFEKTTPFTPSDISVVIWAEVFESGGITGRTRISSLYDVGSESWFKGVASLPLRVKLTFGGGNTTVLAECILDNTKLPTGVQKISIYSRIFEGLIEENVLLLETGSYIFQENLGKINLP